MDEQKEPLTEKQREASRRYARKWHAANRDRKAATDKAWAAANPDKVRAKFRRWSQANPGKKAERDRRYREKNPEKENARAARRRTRKIQATPLWADESEILKVYQLAQSKTKETGIIHHVDHIVPLKSDYVCGLHCEFNLRVIPGRENIVKGNKHGF